MPSTDSQRLRDLLRTHGDEIAAVMARYDATDIAVFGSVARGDAGPDSDIDLLITLPGRDVDQLLSMGALIDELTEILGIEVDVIARAILDAHGRGGEEQRHRICRDAVPLANLTVAATTACMQHADLDAAETSVLKSLEDFEGLEDFETKQLTEIADDNGIDHARQGM